MSFLLLAIFSSLLLLKNHSLYVSTDMPFHFRRIFELRTSFINHDFLPNFAFNNYHGSAVMLFYPYLNLYLIVLLSFIIKSIINLVYIFFILNTFIIFIISFYSCKNYVKNNSTSYIFSIIYGTSNLFFTHNFSTMDFGIVSSYIALPLVIFAFMNIIKNNKNNYLELSLGMTMIAFSHILSLIIITVFLMLWAILNIKNLNKYMIIILIKSILLFLVISSVVYLPLLNFYFNNLNNINMPPSVQLVKSGFGHFLEGIIGKISPDNIGAFALITIFIAIFFYNQFDTINKQIYFLSLGIIALVLLFPRNLTSYGILEILNQFQFTYRLYIIPHILLIFLFSLIITTYVNKYKNRNILYFIVLIFSLFLQLKGQYNFINTYSYNKTINVKNHDEMKNASKYKVTYSNQLMDLININYDQNNDYIPKDALPVSHYINYNKGLYNNNKIIGIKHIGYNKFKFNGNDEINQISLPIYMYNNEKIYTYLNGNMISNFSSKNGLLTINDLDGKIKSSNYIYIRLAPDKFRVIGIILFISGLLFSLVLIILKIINRKK